MNALDDATAATLTDAMETAASPLAAPPDLARRVIARRRKAARWTAAGASLVVAAVVVGVGLAGAALRGGGGEVQPASSATPTANASPATAAQGRHSAFEVTVLPPGYSFDRGSTDPFRRGDTDATVVNERLSYRRAGSRALITLDTFTGAPDAITLDDVKDFPRAEVVHIGTRDVVHVPAADSNGLNVYEWTEGGLDVSVTGRGGATDAELRAFIAGLVRRT
jgi:hypothetical protein